MGITVKEALSIAPLDCCGLVAGINGMDRVIEGLTAVSYTHLDVYKRQAERWPSPVEGARLEIE